MPQVAYLNIQSEEQDYWFTLFANHSHKNPTAVFFEHKTREPEKDYLSVVPGIFGSYPNAIYRLKSSELKRFVNAVENLADEGDYEKLADKYVVRRTHKEFWQYSDQLHKYHQKVSGVDYGILDYNRLENR